MRLQNPSGHGRRSHLLRAGLAAAAAAFFGCPSPGAPASAPPPVTVQPHWRRVTGISRATPTLQVVVNPLLRPGSPIHDAAFQALKKLGANDVRFVPWLPYPRLAVAELQPPARGRTHWDFSLLDPIVLDFFRATRGHSRIVNFSTIPQWMFATRRPVAYPADPDQVNWSYEQGRRLRDPSMRQVAGYYARLVSWYTRGGFRDEYGVWHGSGYHHRIQYWEVLNEVDFEHSMSPRFYTRLYDRVTAAIRRVAPRMKFVGAALAMPSLHPEFFEYFLNPRHHRRGAPLNMISYHFYASPTPRQTLDDWQYTFFDQADHFLDSVRYIQALRRRLAWSTKTDVDELGCILPHDTAPRLARPIPARYWNLCGAMYAYLYARLAGLGVQVAGESQLVGYPSQFPSVTMLDWRNGRPNARYWILKLLLAHFHAGDRLADASSSSAAVFAQGFITPRGRRELLLINKRNRAIEVALPGAGGAAVESVSSPDSPPARAKLQAGRIALAPFEVSVIAWPRH